MATVIDSIGIHGFRITHLKQLLSYLEARDREPWYYGNRQQFEKRHEELRRWLEGNITTFEQDGIRIAK